MAFSDETYPYGLTFDDVLLVPDASDCLPHEVSIRTQLTQQGPTLGIPFLSAAMDTVTESQMAIAMAKSGGIGVIHKNLSPEDQAGMIRKVKKYESGVVQDPVTIKPDQTVKEANELAKEHGFSGFPVVDGKHLIGLITNRDLRFVENNQATVRSVMTKKDQLVTVPVGTSLEQIKALMHQHRIERVLMVNDHFELAGMVTVRDILNAGATPNACKDDKGRLCAAAAVGIGPDTESRLEQLVTESVDTIVIDTAHGHSKSVIDRVQWFAKKYPDVPLIAGNVATSEGALALEKNGAHAIKVGIGPGSICTTRIIAGIGVPQITAIQSVAKKLSPQTHVIADGGIRFSGDVAKALAAGAHAVMLGSCIAGSDQTPGEVEVFQGRTYKSYRGMGSVAAMDKKHGSRDRYFQQKQEKLVPEGVEGRVPYKGCVSDVLDQMSGGVRACMGYLGAPDLKTLRKKSKFMRISPAAMRESHVHDVTITKASPNYSLNEKN
ncbi:IMP dehydrogenase [Gammaproteobacteria bacterium]|nr:IMP dehydrogenase [Gammaproteobacteria bacterium]